MKDPLGVSPSKGNEGTTRGKEKKFFLTSVGIEPTTSGLDLPLLCRLSYEVGQRKSGMIEVVNRGEEKVEQTWTSPGQAKFESYTCPKDKLEFKWVFFSLGVFLTFLVCHYNLVNLSLDLPVKNGFYTLCFVISIAGKLVINSAVLGSFEGLVWLVTFSVLVLGTREVPVSSNDSRMQNHSNQG